MDKLARMRQLIGSTAQWATDDLVLGTGEIAVEVVTGGFKMKIGKDNKPFSACTYVTSGGGSGGKWTDDPAGGIRYAGGDVRIKAGNLHVSGLANPTGSSYLSVNAAGLITRSAANFVTFDINGNLDMAGKRIIGLMDYTAPGSVAPGLDDAASKRYVDNKVGAITGANFIGSKDVRTGGAGIPATASPGDWIVVSADSYDAVGTLKGKMSAAWIAALSPESKLGFLDQAGVPDYTVYAGDDLFYDGAKWHYISASTLHNKFISRFGDNMYGGLTFRTRTSRVNSRPITWAGGFNISSSLTGFVAGGVAHGAGDGLEFSGIYNSSIANFQLRAGIGAAVYHNIRLAGNGSIRIPVTTGSTGHALGSAVHFNAYGTTSPLLVAAYRPDAAGTAGNHKPFTIQFRTRGEKAGSNSTDGAGGTWYTPISFTNDGHIRLPADVTTFTDYDAVHKKYVDTLVQFVASGLTHYVKKDTAGTMTAPLTLYGSPTTTNMAANKGYVDLFLKKTGGYMTGAIQMGNKSIINLADSTGPTQALNRRSGDARYTAKPSDARIKENLYPLDKMLDKVCQLWPLTFNYKNGTAVKLNEMHASHIGLTAQDVQQVFPDLVYCTDLAVSEYSPEKIMAVDYIELIPVLIKAVQELTKEVRNVH